MKYRILLVLAALACTVVSTAYAAPAEQYTDTPEVAAGRYLEAREKLGALRDVTSAAVAACQPELQGRVIEVAGKITGCTSCVSPDGSFVSFYLQPLGVSQAIVIDTPTRHPLLCIGSNVHVLAEFPTGGTPRSHYTLREIVLAVDLPASERERRMAVQVPAAAPAGGANVIDQDPLSKQPDASTSDDDEAAGGQSSDGYGQYPNREVWGNPTAVAAWVGWVRQCNSKLTEMQARGIVESVLYYSQQFQMDHRLAFAMIKCESDFNPSCKSHAGAMGLTQLMPGTAQGLGVSDPWSIQQNVMGGLKYLSNYLHKYEDRSNYEQTILGLACYNAGPNAVKRAGGVPNYKETQNFVKKVTELFVKLYESDMP